MENITVETAAALKIMVAVAEAIRALGTVPSGHLYAQLMGHMDLTTYERIISSLLGAGLISRKNHQIQWIG